MPATVDQVSFNKPFWKLTVGFNYYTPFYDDIKDLEGITERNYAKYYNNITDPNILKYEVGQLFNPDNWPTNRDLSIGCVHGINFKEVMGDESKKYRNFFATKSNYNAYQYDKLVDVISDSIILNDNYMSANHYQSKIYAFHYVIYFRNTDNVTRQWIINCIEDMNNHHARNFIVLSQTINEPYLSNPSLHFIISNACFYYGNERYMSYLFNHKYEKRIDKLIENMQYPIYYGESAF